MKRIWILIITILGYFIFIVSPMPKAAEIELPEEIKVGLAFNDSFGYSQLLPTVKIKAASGMDVIYKGKKTYSFTNGKALIIIKTSELMDKVTVTSASTDVPNPPASTSSQVGDYTVLVSDTAIKLNGKNHIYLNHLFPDYKLAKEYVSALDQQGIYGFPLYMKAGWHVCVGGFKSKSKALETIDELYKKNSWLKAEDLDVFNPDSSEIKNKTGLAVIKENGKLFFMAYIDNDKLEFKPRKDTEFISLFTDNVNAYREYRGRLQIFRASGQSFSVVNIVNFEEYLWGVVPAEMSGSSPIEALKAQSVASRTYAYNQIKPTNRHASNGFDICASVHCHVYRGIAVEHPNSTKAVKDTVGQLVLYKDSVAKVFYYSSNGGSTEDVKYVWGRSYPYLISVKDDFESPGTTNYTWEREFSLVDIESKLSGYKLGDIYDVKIVSKTPAGRPKHVQVVGSNGVKDFNNESCRTFLGLPSQNYTLSTNANVRVLNSNGKNKSIRLADKAVLTEDGEEKFDFSSQMINIIGGNTTAQVSLRPTKYIFKGKGWGHAIGMSQNGAMGAARQGLKYKQILKHYFPGTQIK